MQPWQPAAFSAQSALLESAERCIAWDATVYGDLPGAHAACDRNRALVVRQNNARLLAHRPVLALERPHDQFSRSRSRQRLAVARATLNLSGSPRLDVCQYGKQLVELLRRRSSRRSASRALSSSVFVGV